MCQNRLIWSGEDPELRFLFAFEVPRLTVSNVCYLVFTDHHQSAAAVLRPAGQELPLLLREGEDSEYCRSAASAFSSSSARAPPCDGGSLRSLVLHSLGEGINILDPAAHFCASASVVSSSDPSSTCHRLAFHHVLFFLTFRSCLFFSVSLLRPPAALCADEQHPADEGPVGEDVWVHGSKTGEHSHTHTHTFMLRRGESDGPTGENFYCSSK